jgi:signal transduction histidine kinase
VLVGLTLPVGVVEALLRPDMVWRWFSLLVLVPTAFAMLYRRSHPLPVVVTVFGVVGAFNFYSLLVGENWEGLFTMATVLILIYCLGRWGSGRDIIIGMTVVVTGTAIDIFTYDPLLLSEVLGGFLILGLTIEMGFIVRTLVNSRAQMVDRARSAERELLARELHDTVAHHVSAIAIQAQAGRAQAATKPEAALDALAVIETEASKTLTEMRAMVGTLRDGDQPDYTPQPGVGDLDELGSHSGGSLPVHVELTGNLGELRPAVDAAVFRLAQESVTNAMRHARNASRVAVNVYGGAESVRLIVDDDGEQATGGTSNHDAGFGLIGMAERAKLLGGTLVAGPRPGRGWVVDATIPRNGGLL